MSREGWRCGIPARTWAISHCLVTIAAAGSYAIIVGYTYTNVLDHHKLSLTSNEKHALLLTGVVYAALAVVALVGLVGCLTEALGLLQVYEKVTWGFYLAQIGVAVWFIHAIFYNRKCLLWKCKHIFGSLTSANKPLSPSYDSLDPAKACKLLQKWGPVGAIIGALVILVNELDNCFALWEYCEELKEEGK